MRNVSRVLLAVSVALLLGIGLIAPSDAASKKPTPKPNPLAHAHRSSAIGNTKGLRLEQMEVVLSYPDDLTGIQADVYRAHVYAGATVPSSSDVSVVTYMTMFFNPSAMANAQIGIVRDKDGTYVYWYDVNGASCSEPGSVSFTYPTYQGCRTPYNDTSFPVGGVSSEGSDIIGFGYGSNLGYNGWEGWVRDDNLVWHIVGNFNEQSQLGFAPEVITEVGWPYNAPVPTTQPWQDSVTWTPVVGVTWSAPELRWLGDTSTTPWPASGDFRHGKTWTGNIGDRSRAPSTGAPDWCDLAEDSSQWTWAFQRLPYLGQRVVFTGAPWQPADADGKVLPPGCVIGLW